MLREANSLLNTLSDYYITNRSKYIKQLSNGSYPHVKNKYTKQFVPLTDRVLQRHLDHKETVGIFCNELTKFICFDVDTGSDEDLQLLVSTLIEQPGISEVNILTSFSGNKGYHVELFFNKPISYEVVEDFYYKVLLACDFDIDEVELRPKATIGVKLPLGLNQVTGVKCSFIDWLTFAELPDETIKSIVKLDKQEFIQRNELSRGKHRLKYNTKIYNRELNNQRITKELQQYNTKEQAQEIANVVTSLNFDVKNVNPAIHDIEKVLKRGYFEPYGSYKRHNYTFLIAIYLKEQRVEQKATQEVINKIMQATRENYKDLIKSSVEFTERETERIVKLVYLKDYKLLGQQVEIYFTLDELMNMLSIDSKQQRKLYLALIGHAKRFNRINEVFCMTYETMRAMNIKNNGTAMKQNLKELADNGYIEILRSGKYNQELLNSYNVTQKLPNLYRIKKSFNQNSDQKVFVKADTSNSNPIELLAKAYKNNVININDVKNYLSKYQFRKFKQSL